MATDGHIRDKGAITMKARQFNDDRFWAKAAALVVAGLLLVFLPDWGRELRAQALPISLSPASVDFGEVPVGTTSAQLTVTLSNQTESDIEVVSVGVAGNNFSVTNNCPEFLPELSSCSIGLTFTPATPGIQTATLEVVVDTCGEGCFQSLVATLTGVGVVSIDAVDDAAVTPAGTPVAIPVLANDVGTGLSITQVTPPAHGSAAANPDGTITYTPAANFAGGDSFTYTIINSFGQTDSATVTVTVIAPALDAVNDATTTPAGTPVAIPVLANDVGTGLSITQVTPPAHGSAAANPDGTITYTSVPNFTGADAFTYTITDGIGTDTATVTVTVTRGKEDTQKLLEDSTDNPNAKEIGQTIGGLCFDQAASTNFLRDCDDLIDAAGNGDPGVGQALQQITPDALGIAVDASLTSAQAQMVNVKSRMTSLRTGVMGINLDRLNIQRGGWTLSGRDLRYLLASLGGGGPSADADMNLGALGIFASGTLNLGNKDGTENQTGFDFKTVALTVGADYRFSDQVVLGAALSYSLIDSDVDGNGGYLDTRGYSLTLYGTYYPSDQFYIDGMVNYGWNDYDQQRNVVYQVQNTKVNQQFDSNYSGKQFFVDVGTGYEFTRGNLIFGPEARLSYLDVRVDPFQERADNDNPGSAWAVAIERQDLQSLVLSLGGRASYLIDQSWGVLQPQVEFSWLHEFNDDNRAVIGRFVEGAVVPDNIFQLVTDPVDKNYFKLSLGLLARFNRGPSALIQYRTLFDYANLEEHAITAQLRWEF
jgi:outer membrane autotransporter protein